MPASLCHPQRKLFLEQLPGELMKHWLVNSEQLIYVACSSSLWKPSFFSTAGIMSAITAVVGGRHLSFHPLEAGRGKHRNCTAEQWLASDSKKRAAALAVMLQLVRGTDILTVDNLRVWVCNSHFSAVITEDSRRLHQRGNVWTTNHKLS